MLKEYSAEIGVSLETDQLRQFMIYLEQLRVWNQSVNLTGITGDEEIIIKHFFDSMAGLKAEDVILGATLLDVGTGAGFPGIPMKIVRQDLDVTLIEPVQKKISFLHFIVGLLRLEKVKIFHGTLERFMIDEFSDQSVGSFDYVTTRALKYDVVLRNSSKLLASHGKVILYSSHSINKLDLGADWSIINEYMFDLPRKFGRRVVSVLSAS